MIGKEKGEGTNVGVLVVQVCAAESGGGDFDMDLVAGQGSEGGVGLDDVARFGAFEGCERDFV